MSADNFADRTPLPPGTLGQSFRLEFPFAEDDVADHLYSDGELTLSLKRRLSPMPTIEVRGLHGFVLAERTQRLGTYEGTNAFGASTEVFKSKSQTDVLILAKHPESHRSSSWIIYSTQLNATGSEAKSIIANTVAIIEGTISQTEKGRSTGCDTGRTSPTLSSPFERTDEVCWVAVDVDRVAFINKADGTIIKEWADKPVPAAN